MRRGSSSSATGSGSTLDPQTVALPGLDLKGAILFQYDGKPLGQVAYLSTEYGPVAFCIIAQRPRGCAARLRGARRA